MSFFRYSALRNRKWIEINCLMAMPGTPREGQALCFFAGANSIFFGDKLLTAKNPEVDVDLALLRELGLEVEKSAEQLASA